MRNSTLGVLLTIIALSIISVRSESLFPKHSKKVSLQSIKPTAVQPIYADINEDCNITHFEFISDISLGNNDELNRTFKQIGQKITKLDDVTWRVNETTSFSLSDANPEFYYRDTKQKAEIVGNDTIMINGGYVEADITFKWSKSGDSSKNGTAKVMGLSDEIMFLKQIVIDGHFFRYQLKQYKNVTFDQPMDFVRIEPANTSDEDKRSILMLVNNLINITTLRHELEDDIERFFHFYLASNIHDQSSPIDEKFEYQWKDPVTSRGDLIIKFTRRPTFIDIEKDGMHYGFEARIDDFNQTKCGPMPPTNPLSPRVYGGAQQFITYTFYENVLRYAIVKGHLDSPLTRELWESRMFQFYAGDLYEVFPKVSSVYGPRAVVSGSCKASSDKLAIRKAGNHTFFVDLHSDCELNVNKTKVHGFAVQLELEVQGDAYYDHMDFKLKKHTQNVTFTEYDGYVMKNEELAREMINHSLNRLYQGKLIGSGWLTHPKRNFPHFMAQQQSTLVYDSTHVDLSGLNLSFD